MKVLICALAMTFSLAAQGSALHNAACLIWNDIQNASDEEFAERIKSELRLSGVEFLDFDCFLVISPSKKTKLNRLAEYVAETYAQNFVFITKPYLESILKTQVLHNDLIVDWPEFMIGHAKRRSEADLQVIVSYIRRNK